MKNRRKGFALISTLLFLGIMFMMSLSMVVMSRHRVFSGLTQHHKSQALYLAEAGLAKSQVALEADLEWLGEAEGKVDGIPGTYKVQFGVDRFGSVNNIGKSSPAESYRGSDSVPPNTALLIVTANVSGQTYTLEALVRGSGSVGFMTDAILASGKIRAKGDLKVDGVAALNDSKAVDGSIQSNDSSGSNTVVWEGGGSAHIAGNVGTGGASSGIHMPGAVIDGSLEANAPANIPRTDIVAEVNNNMTHPAPSFVALGTTHLPGGKYSVAGANLSGDLVLEDGATIYVNGDLDINGSIRGKGTVYVTGKTTFRGDSQVTTNENFSVALYSKGDVRLTGFDGTAFLEAMGSDAQESLAIAKGALSDMQSALKSGPTANTGALTNAASALGKHDEGSGSEKDGILDVWGGYKQPNTLGTLKSLAEAGPPGETRDFLVERLGVMSDMFSSPDMVIGSGIGSYETRARAGFERGLTVGVVDAFFTEARNGNFEKWGQITNLVNSVNYDKLGSSYFLGAIYTQGRFIAENEVTIIGALMADADEGGAEENINLKNGTSVRMRPGDIYLGNRTSVTYVEEMFKDEDEVSYAGPQLLEKNIWMGR